MNMFNNGYGYTNQPPAQVPFTNPLTKEDRELLQRMTPAFTLDATPEDIARAKCTHKDPSKHMFTLINNNDGTCTCTQCGATFTMAELPEEEVEKIVGAFIDILQTIKVAYVDMPNDAVKTYFQMIPFIEKAPKLYANAMQTMKRLMPGAGVQNATPYGGNAFNFLNNAVGNPGMMYGGMGMPYQQPNMAYQQQVDPNYGTTPYQNGFTGFNQMAPMPGANPFQAQMPYGQQAQFGAQQYMPYGQQTQQQSNIIDADAKEVQSTATAQTGEVKVDKPFQI